MSENYTYLMTFLPGDTSLSVLGCRGGSLMLFNKPQSFYNVWTNARHGSGYLPVMPNRLSLHEWLRMLLIFNG